MTARTLSIRSSRLAMPTSRSRPGAAFVEQDQSRKGSETGEEVRSLGRFPPELDVGYKTEHINEIERSAADDLISDPHIATLGIPGFRRFHSFLPVCLAEVTKSQGRARWIS